MIRFRASLVVLVISGVLAGRSLPAQIDIRCGSWLSGNLVAAQQDVYRFRAEAGDLILFSLIGSGSGFSYKVQADIFLEGSPTAVISIGPFGSGGYGGGTAYFAVPDTASYILKVHDASFMSQGYYEFNIEWIRPLGHQCADLLLCGQRLWEELINTEMDFFNFEGKAGEVWSISLMSSGNSYPYNNGVMAYVLGPSLDTATPIAVLGRDKPSSADLLLQGDGTYTIFLVIPGCAGRWTYNLTLTGVGCDCNGNGEPDDVDIRIGTSLDANKDGVPDECQIGGRVQLGRSADDPGAVEVILQNYVPIRGGELGIAYNSAVVVPDRIVPDPVLLAGADVRTRLDAGLENCPADPEVDRGIEIGWVNSLDHEAVLPPGTGTLFTIVFKPAPGADPGRCSPLEFRDCLGIPLAPIRNIVTNEKDQSLALHVLDGKVCPPSPKGTFRRGDRNGDGAFDISDPIGILTCLFLAASCGDCLDASDANDDGSLSVSDAIFLILWRFNDGPAPSQPFPNCGDDPTPDDLQCTGSNC